MDNNMADIDDIDGVFNTDEIDTVVDTDDMDDVDDIAPLTRYGTRALELPPHVQARLDRRVQQLHKNEIPIPNSQTSHDNTSGKIDPP